MREKAYYYLHINKSLIRKTIHVVDHVGAEEYFSGSMVIKYWLITTDEEYAKMIEEAEELQERNWTL